MVREADGDSQKPIYPIGSVDSALRLLLMVGRRDRVRIAEAAEELDVARSTAHRLMQMLVYHGLVSQDEESKAYVAGSRLIGLGLQVVRRLDVREIAHPHLEALARRFEETVQLFTLQTEQDVLCLTAVKSERTLRIGTHIGAVLPAEGSSAGLALLSTRPTEEILRLYPQERLPRRDRSALRLHSELLTRLETARALGYAELRDESEPGVSATSVPVRVADEPAAYAVAVAVPSIRLDESNARAIGAAARRTAAEIAAALGL